MPDGHQRYCRVCGRKKDAKNYAESPRRRKAIRHNSRAMITANRLKVRVTLAFSPCVDCGEKDPDVLEFDHVRGRKRGDISTMAAGSFSWRAIAAEMEKCEVRCANCHRRRHARARRNGNATATGPSEDLKNAS